jgi:hypothetical protein
VLNDQFIVGLHPPEVFITFWLLVALSVALPRMPHGAAAFLLSAPAPTGRTSDRRTDHKPFLLRKSK